MLDENAMPIPRQHTETRPETPDYSWDGGGLQIRFPGGAIAYVQGTEGWLLLDQADRHGAEILWNYLGVATEGDDDDGL